MFVYGYTLGINFADIPGPRLGSHARPRPPAGFARAPPGAIGMTLSCNYRVLGMIHCDVFLGFNIGEITNFKAAASSPKSRTDAVR